MFLSNKNCNKCRVHKLKLKPKKNIYRHKFCPKNRITGPSAMYEL